MGNLELAEFEKDAENRNMFLSRAEIAVERGSALTQQLLSFSRKQTLFPKVVEANKLVSETFKLIERTLGEIIEIETQICDGSLPIKIDTAMFSNAVLNLSLNARDAMPNGGKLTVSTTKAELDGEITGEDNIPLTGLYACLRVTDTGHGIAREHLDKVVDPFFTTKEVGEGSGLGLSMVYGFIEQSGGHIEIDSEPGKGTTISLYFPLTEEKMENSDDPYPIHQSKVKSTVQSRTILLVEDDPGVLDITKRVLIDIGYEVLEAVDGPSAEKILSEKSEVIDMVFSDMVMPRGISGLDLVKLIKSEYKHIKVLLTSGYPDTIAGEPQARLSGVEILAKPYKKAELAKTIDEVFLS